MIDRQELHHPYLLDFARKKIEKSGRICQTADGFIYLKVTDDFIHQLFPLLPESEKKIPDYFTGQSPIGAHISLIYPEEKRISSKVKELGQRISFEVTGLFKAILNEKTYFALEINS